MKEKAVREPKQARSIQMKEKIVDAAYRLFCEKGYYKTSTNEIAREAGVSIGSLYSYFKDKDTIFMEILGRYHMEFIAANGRMTSSRVSPMQDFRAWMRELIENLIQMHEIGKELNHELNILCYTKPEVAAVMEQHLAETRKITLDYFNEFRDEIRYDDVEAAAIVSYDFISTVIDGIVFGKYQIGRERVIGACVEAVYRFLTNGETISTPGG